MKRSNVVVLALLAIASCFLLGRWLYHGWNLVEPPIDVVVVLIWWAILVVAAVLMWRAEQVRRERVRTVYLYDGGIYQSEAGRIRVRAGESPVDAAARVLGSLTYRDGMTDKPAVAGPGAPSWRYIVHTARFAQGGRTWSGDVVDVATGAVSPFTSRSELKAIVG